MYIFFILTKKFNVKASLYPQRCTLANAHFDHLLKRPKAKWNNEVYPLLGNILALLYYILHDAHTPKTLGKS